MSPKASRTGVPALAVALIAGACGGDGGGRPAPRAADPPPGPPAQVAGPAADGEVAAGAFASPSDPVGETGERPRSVPRTAPCGIELALRLVAGEVRWGGTAEATVVVTNRTDGPVVLWDLEADLARRLAMRGTHLGARWSVRQPPAAAAGGGTGATKLDPGRSAEFGVDLAPWFRSAPGFAPGSFRFDLAWSGDPAVAPASAEAWNAVAENLATTHETTVDVLPPRWLSDLGADADSVHAVANELVVWSAGGTAADAAVGRLLTRGAAGIGCVAFHASASDSGTPGADERAGRAIEVLLRIGRPALVVLRSVGTPAAAMTAEAIEADGVVRDPAARGEAALAAALASGEAGATGLHVTLRGRAGAPDTFVSVDPDGRILVVKGQGGPSESATSRVLSEDELDTLRSALVSARPWCWRRLRSVSRAGEGLACFSFVRDGKVAWTVTLPQDEARLANPLAARALAAVEALLPGGSARLAARGE